MADVRHFWTLVELYYIIPTFRKRYLYDMEYVAHVYTHFELQIDLSTMVLGKLTVHIVQVF